MAKVCGLSMENQQRSSAKPCITKAKMPVRPHLCQQILVNMFHQLFQTHRMARLTNSRQANPASPHGDSMCQMTRTSPIPPILSSTSGINMGHMTLPRTSLKDTINQRHHIAAPLQLAVDGTGYVQ